MKSAEVTVRRLIPAPNDLKDRPTWGWAFHMDSRRFGFQGQRQFYADESGQSEYSNHIRVGSDGRECWAFVAHKRPQDEKQVSFCPYEAVADKSVVICDPFGSQRFPSAEEAIETLKLEYLDTVEYEGMSCYRIRSWASSVDAEGFDTVFHDWLIDAQSLLPVVYDSIFSYAFNARLEFLYEHVNEPIAQEAFQAPAAPDIVRKPLAPEEGYGRLYWRACDGSDGEVHVNFGQSGPKGGKGGGG
jgi:hypothetical protein